MRQRYVHMRFVIKLGDLDEAEPDVPAKKPRQASKKAIEAPKKRDRNPRES